VVSEGVRKIEQTSGGFFEGVPEGGSGWSTGSLRESLVGSYFSLGTPPTLVTSPVEK